MSGKTALGNMWKWSPLPFQNWVYRCFVVFQIFLFFPSQAVVPAAKEAYIKETGKKCDIVVDETNFLLADRYLLASLLPTTQVLIIHIMWNGMKKNREHLDT